ncbi:Ketol-acid reductoisomerase [Wickerhamomyces ciferrii]|uniref:Ketol-acid reductoisomerase n=1 Tax=Wickerhamomyces ciferrii (strain ATCC 14091 / BCRC 22168 / CBS 111 / JCM 3599 / NBRC 0793 / NRRL Y-1031 F-60-10) TaxID=1206466 RepID=K0KMT0_WICCF|nr:Ketol-acid reductoisomerase [Wickerhamomyces ciferrii]CCH42428.1 Ketol-acid reductoisomerase [Wickerhamomyces ciferrii]
MSETIGFIGVGQIGGTVARLAVDAGYKVVLSNSRGPESLSGVISSLGENAKADTSANIAKDKNIKIIVLSIPLNAVPTLLPSLGLKNKVILDTSNYYPVREGNLEELDSNKLTTSEYVSKYLDSSNKLVKIFNNIFSFHLRNSATQDESNQTILPIAGDDDEAKKLTNDFVQKIGYKTYDVGPSSLSWKFEPNTPFYGGIYLPEAPKDLDHDGLKEFYKKSQANPLTYEKAKEVLDSTERSTVVGGRPENYPKYLTEIVYDLYAQQAKDKASGNSKLIL